MGNTPIDAGAVKLAGLLVDGLQRVRAEKDPAFLDWFECFMKMTPEQRAQALAPYMADPRFRLANAFDLVVPAGYEHATRLVAFKVAHRSEFDDYDPNITDEHFKRATTKLAPDRKFRVKVFQITEIVSSEDCLTFLRSQKAVLVGAQGVTLAHEFAKNMPRDSWYISFDKKDALWEDSGGRHRVPYVLCSSSGRHELRLTSFESDWDGNIVHIFYLLCFCPATAISA